MRFAHLLLALLLPLFWGSCRKYEDCRERIIKEADFNDTARIDTAAKVIRCEKGSGFTIKVDSSYKQTWPKITGGFYLCSYFGYDFSDVTHDYIIVLIRSGKTYKVSDIKYGHEKWSYGLMPGGGSGNDPTLSCSYGYTLDGQVVFIAAKEYNQAGAIAYLEL